MALAQAVRLRILGVAVAAALIILPCPAQDEKENKDDLFWAVRHRQEVGSAAQLVLARNPLTIALLRDEGLRWKVWLEPEFIGDTAPALNGEWLDDVIDDTPMPDFRTKPKPEFRRDQISVYKVWSQAVIFANNTPPEAFAKSAQENSHVTFSHLWNDPAKYRGKVIPVKGRLARLRKFDATLDAQKEGVKFVYEGWIFGPTRGSYPYCVLFTNLPEGLKESEDMNREVSFNGYFLKKMKYPARDGSKVLQAPVLIGPTLTLAKEVRPAETTPISMTMVASVMIFVAVGALGLVLLSWHFRRGDRELKSRLANIQAERAMAMMDEVTSEGAEENAGGDTKQVPPQAFTADPPPNGNARLN